MTWHVLSTVEPGYKPIYFIVDGKTHFFLMKGPPPYRLRRFRDLKKAMEVRDRLNRKEGD